MSLHESTLTDQQRDIINEIRMSAHRRQDSIAYESDSVIIEQSLRLYNELDNPQEMLETLL